VDGPQKRSGLLREEKIISRLPAMGLALRVYSSWYGSHRLYFPTQRRSWKISNDRTLKKLYSLFRFLSSRCLSYAVSMLSCPLHCVAGDLLDSNPTSAGNLRFFSYRARLHAVSHWRVSIAENYRRMQASSAIRLQCLGTRLKGHSVFTNTFILFSTFFCHLFLSHCLCCGLLFKIPSFFSFFSL
jgi:hypothetical protein